MSAKDYGSWSLDQIKSELRKRNAKVIGKKGILVQRKYLICDLINKETPIEVWLQGNIEQTVGTDILIISDGSGRAKITKCDSADGVIDKSCLKKGTYCCILGTVLRSKGLPEVQASKFVDLTSKPHMRDAWDSEVKESKLYFQGKIIPSI